MYTLTAPYDNVERPTLLGIFQYARGDFEFSNLDLSDVSLKRWNKDPITVTRFDGQFAIRESGPTSAVIHNMLAEVFFHHWTRDGRRLAAHEMLPEVWDLVFWIFFLCRTPKLFLSIAQMDELKEAGQHPRDLCDATLKEIFKFGELGPVVSGTNLQSPDHLSHLGYALLQNLDVPEDVLDAYRDSERKYGDGWVRLLIDVPEFRGRLNRGQLDALDMLVRHSQLVITPQNAMELVRLMAIAGATPTFVQTDDVLFEAGLLKALPLPPAYEASVEIGVTDSPLAQAIRRHIADGQRLKSLEHVQQERQRGNKSQRAFTLAMQTIELDHERYPVKWANEMADVVARRDIVRMLSWLDNPDDRNRGSKKALYEVLGVKLLGRRAKDRRRALFAMCGFDEQQQADWEVDAKKAEEKADAEREKIRARERAAVVFYQTHDGTRIDGATHVESAVQSGFNALKSYKRGAVTHFYLEKSGASEARRLQAKDGTLAYARCLLAAA